VSGVPLIDAQVERAIEEPALLGESPLWHPIEQVLYYCDIPGRRVHRFDPCTGEAKQWPIDTEPTSLAPMAPPDQLLLACRDGLWRFDTASGARHALAPAPYDTTHERFNDGKCDPQGRFWVGTIYEPRHPASAALYRFGEGKLLRMADAITVSNGLAWSPDARTMFWSDTKAHTIFALDFDPVDGAIGPRRTFAQFPVKTDGQDLATYGGRPDGAAMDADGCYWVAMFEGRRLLKLSPCGAVLGELRLPVQCPTMVCFGDADLRTLYITTAREKRPAQELAEQPWAGCVLKARVDVPGLPASCFGV
jgi:sugar lactone lactonase YvrE